jgi:hypothetical protein
MNRNGEALLADPNPGSHIVYTYTDDAQVAAAVCLFASAGLRKGQAVLLVMTKEHRRLIRRHLEEEGFNLRSLEKAGLLVCEDAGDLLSAFMIDGAPDERVFKAKIGAMIEKAKASGGSRPRRQVRVFGEMVDLIWKGNPNGTHRLELLWNEVIEEHSVPLLCAYALAGTERTAFPETLVACHSHAIA